MELDNLGNGILVVSFKDDEASVFSVSEYQSKRDGFTVKLTSLDDETISTETFNFVVYEAGIICSEDVDSGDQEFCMMQSEVLEASRTSALKEFEKLKTGNTEL